MEEANKRINQILAMDEEDYTDEIIEEFVQELKGAKFLIPMEVDEESIDLDSLGEDEEIELGEDVEFLIIKMEDEDGNEFIPVFTGDFETEIDLPGTGWSWMLKILLFYCLMRNWIMKKWIQSTSIHLQTILLKWASITI